MSDKNDIIFAIGPAGTGKTLSILAYLATQNKTLPRITSELTNNSSKYFFSHDLYKLSDIQSTNLIIVPHSLFGQWRQEITTHTNMQFVPIETKRFLNVNKTNCYRCDTCCVCRVNDFCT